MNRDKPLRAGSAGSPPGTRNSNLLRVILLRKICQKIAGPFGIRVDGVAKGANISNIEFLSYSLPSWPAASITLLLAEFPLPFRWLTRTFWTMRSRKAGAHAATSCENMLCEITPLMRIVQPNLSCAVHTLQKRTIGQSPRPTKARVVSQFEFRSSRPT
jgi:hypothetical protein